MDATRDYGTETVAKVFMHELGHGINAWEGGPPHSNIGYHNPDPSVSVMCPWAGDAKVIDYSDLEWQNLLVNRIANPV